MPCDGLYADVSFDRDTSFDNTSISDGDNHKLGKLLNEVKAYKKGFSENLRFISGDPYQHKRQNYSKSI